ncbi:MAG: T9SS type A sorting domain-containing protein [Cytophagales bacterium]|nr:T9SS type A sorting domain-containing protein [Cytophagales bacterium]
MTRFPVVLPPPANIPFAASQNFTISTTYTPPWQGIYNVDFLVTQDSTDCVPGNNTLSSSFEVTDTVYARDDGTGSGSLWAGDSNDYIFGQTYQLQATDNLKSITCWVSGNVGAVMRLVVYNMAAGLPNTLLGASSNYTLTSGDMPSAILTLPINGGPLVLAAGTYFVALEAFNAPSDSLFGVYSDNIYTPNTTFASINGGAFNNLENLGGFQLAFVIRPNFVYTPYNNDVALNTVDYYSSIPESQIDSIFFEGRCANNGADPQNNVILSVNITGSGTYSGASPAGVTLSPGTDSLLTMTTSFTPSPGGNYNMDFTLSQNEAEQFPPDNSDSATFVVSDSVYARDNGNYTGAGLWNGAGNSYELGNTFEITNSAEALSVSVYLHPATVAGSIIKAKLYDGSLTPIDSSANYTIQVGNINSGFITLPFLITPILAPAAYLAVIAQPNFDDTVAVASGSDIDQPSYTSFLRDTAGTGTWSLLSSTSFVRLNVIDACPTLTLSPSSFVCEGDSTTLNASGGFTTYSWSPSASLSAGTGSSVIAFPSTTTTYTVIGTSPGCADTGTVTVSVNVNPIVSVTPPGDTICTGQSTLLIASGADNYSWSPSTGLDTTSGDTVTASPSTTTTYIVIGTNTDNCDSEDTVTVTVNPIPAAPTAGTDAVYCSGDPVADLTATGTGIEWFSDAGLTTLIGTGSPFAIFPGIGTTIYYVTQTVNGCQSPYDSVVILVYQTPTPANAGPDQNLCDITTTTLAGNIPAVGTGIWTVVSGTATITTPTSSTSGVTGLITGTSATLTWTISNGSCPSSVDTVNINVDQLPTTANAGSDQNLCNVTTTTLAGNTPVVGTGIWAVISGTATITTPASPASGVTGLIVGASATLTWTISNGSCPSSFDTVIVNVDQLPTTANAGPDQNLCDITTTTLAGNTPAVGTGIWAVVSGTATITTPALPTSGVTGLITGASATLTWTISNGSCPNSVDTVNINVDQLPATANAGSDQNLCNVTTTTLAGNTPVVGTGIWAVISGTATITTPASPASGVTGLIVGASATLTWTLSNGSCPGSVDSVIITVDQLPTTANAGPDQNLCNITTTTLAGNTPAVGTGLWTVVSGTATITSPALPASGVTGLIAGASTTLTWTISNGSCPTSVDSVIINVDQLPTTANAGPDQNMCNVTTTTLAGNTPIVGTGVWIVIVGTATITSPASSASGVTGLINGASATLAWTISNGSCLSSVDTTVISVDALPTSANAGPNQNLCNVTTTTLTGNAPAVGSGIWAVVSGTATITTPTSPTSSVTGLITSASATLTWTISNGSCTNSIDSVIINVDQLPTVANAGPDQNLCNITTTTLASNTPAVGTGLWAVVSGTATVTIPTSPTSGVTGLVAGASATLTWTISNGSCTSSVDTMLIAVDLLPTTANAGPDQTLCSYDTIAILAGNSPVIGTGTWTVVSGTATIATPSSPVSVVTGLLVGDTTVLRWIISNGSCTNSTDDMIIIVTPALSIDSASSTNVSVCGASDGTITITASGGTLPLQYSIDGGSTFFGSGIFTGLSTGNYSVVVFDSNGCIITGDTLIITTPGAPAAPIAGTNATYCNGDVMADLTATAGSGGILTWYSDLGLTTIIDTGTTLTPDTIVGSTTYYVTETVSGCESPSSLVVITVNPLPVTSAITGITSVCENETGVAYSVINTIGSVYNWTAPPGATILSGQGTNSITVNWGSTSGNIQVTQTDTNGCTNNPVSLAVTVNTSLPASVSIASNTDTICSGDNVIFTSTPTNGGGTPAYQWQVNGSNVGTNSPTYSTTILNNGDVVTCIMTSSLSCVTGSPDTSNAITMTVTPSLPASVAISVSDNPICGGDNVIFTATPTNGGGTPAYQWQVNGSIVGANSAIFSTSGLNDGDSITCIMTSSLTCATGSPATSNAVVMAVNPLPVPVINQFDTLLGVDTTYNSYQWLLYGIPMPGDTFQFHIVIVAGSYSVSVTDTNGCTATSDSLFVAVSGVFDLELSNNLKIYPNPANNLLNIEAINIQLRSITIINSLGQVVIVKKLIDKNSYRLDVSGLEQGIYFLQIYTNKGMFMKNVGINK